LSIRFEKRFSPAVRKLRTKLEGPERILFEVLTAAGQLGYRLPDDDIKLRAASGRKDPRRRLGVEFRAVRRAHDFSRRKIWKKAGDRLVRRLLKQLSVKDLAEEDRLLRVLLAYASIVVAPDCAVPKDPLWRLVWDISVNLFARIFPSGVSLLGPLDCVQSRLSALRRETRAGLKIGRLASGKTPGPEGRNLAVDPALISSVGRALGKRLAPGYMARFLFYTKPGDHIWPHPDDPKFDATVLACVRHDLPPDGSTASAFVAYSRDGKCTRYPLAPGSVLALEPGLIHAREPVKPGERVVLLSIGLVRQKRRGRSTVTKPAR